MLPIIPNRQVKKHRFSLRIDDAMLTRCAAEAIRRDVPVAVFIRDCVRATLATGLPPAQSALSGRKK